MPKSKNWGQDYMLNNKKEFKALQDFYCGKQEEKKNTNKTPKKKKRKQTARVAFVRKLLEAGI